MSHQIKKVVISSTASDLPLHRKEVVEACLRQNAFPLRMEDLAASSDDAAAASLEMVEDADVYLGVFANRYGYVPKANNPTQISVTEMEYNRAVERKIERLIFIMDKAHSITVDDVEIENAAKLKAFKDRVQAENIVRFFKSAEDLRAEAINSLSKLREPELNAFHYVSDIPEPPEAFIAHPYTLLQTHRLVGRQQELNLLTDWVARPDSEIYQAYILNVVAIGGLGKSALTWHWFNDIAPQEMKPLAGRMWWSFYESDATFENFITRALAYVTRRALDEVQKIPAPEREAQLLAVLDREPFLIVLDGLERMLIAYARMDAAHLSDDDCDKQTANFVANAYGLPASAAQSFTGEHRLRKIADPRVGAFLRKLAHVQSTRILVSTRLYPADLQTGTDVPLPGCSAIFMRGLVDADALELWRAFGVASARDLLLPLFNRVGNHPLLVQALASEVARYRPAPGDFEQWQRDHPDFDPFSLPLVQMKSHVLEFALRGLEDKAREALHVIAAFRMPARYDTLAALLIGEGKACADERELDEMLTELEDRGLIGWDKRANRYDLHPIVRGVVWGGLGNDIRREVFESLHAYFEALPMTNRDDVNSLEDLTPAIELYNTLIGLGRYDDALELFSARIHSALLFRLNASRMHTELLMRLFPTGLGQLPQLVNANYRVLALTALAQGCQIGEQPGLAAKLFSRAYTLIKEYGMAEELPMCLINQAYALRLSGFLRQSEGSIFQVLFLGTGSYNRFLESMCLYYLGLTQATRGETGDALAILRRALRILTAHKIPQWEGLVNRYMAQSLLWFGDAPNALLLAERGWELAHVARYEREFIDAARLQGEAALGLNDFATADERLHHALTRARMVSLAEEELPALVALAELRRRQGDVKAAREFLDDVWEAAERGPYPLIHADACNILAQIEQDEGNHEKAIEAATRAYRLAWCDGPPFAYHWGLKKARKHLKELGAVEPEMPPFDESKFEPMPEVEIDPEDEFHAGKSADS